jgi:hypothetical protein
MSLHLKSLEFIHLQRSSSLVWHADILPFSCEKKFLVHDTGVSLLQCKYILDLSSIHGAVETFIKMFPNFNIY